MPETNRKQQKKKFEDPLARVENPHAAGIDVGAVLRIKRLGFTLTATEMLA